MLKFHARTDVGLKRKHNEDSLLAAEEFGVFVVADGVGGRKAGELASAITVNTFQGYAPQIRAGVEAFAAENNRETRNAVLTLLDQAANASSRRVYESAAATGRQGMTTTLVAVAVGGGAAFVVHVGDSRAYLVRNAELRQLTDDHSMVNELIRRGEMTPEEALTSRYKNVITRAVGLYPTVQTDTLHVELLDGDRILLCSDGVTDMVPVPRILEHLIGADLVASVDRLVVSALEGGGRDNITAICIQPEAVLEAEAVVARAKAMEGLFLFQDLPFHARLRVGQIVSELFVTPGQRIVKQGDLGDTLYVVVQGQFSILIDGKQFGELSQGSHFGEISLVDSSPRTADIVANGFGHLLAIDREGLRQYCTLEPALGNLMVWRLLQSVVGRLRSADEKLGKL